MSIIKIGNRTNNFAILDKGFLENDALSWKAKGLLAYLLSRPENWQVRVNHLTNCSKDGRDANYAALKELEAAGYIQKEAVRDSRGRVTEMAYIVFEKPQTLPQKSPLPAFQEVVENGENTGSHPLPAFPDLEKPDLVSPDLENPPLINTDITKNEYTKDRQTKDLSVSFLPEKLIDRSLKGNQWQAIRTLVEDLVKTQKIGDPEDLVQQIAFVLLDERAFTKAGKDFAFKLNSIAKVIRAGRWEMPTAYSPEVKAKNIGQMEQERKSLKEKIQHLKNMIHSAEEAARMFANNAELVEYHNNNAQMSRQQLAELQTKLAELSAPSNGNLGGAAA